MTFGIYDYKETECKKPVVIIGAGELARNVAMYLDLDSPYSVEAFVVDDGFDLATPYGEYPCILYSNLLEIYPPEKFQVFVAFSAQKMSLPRLERFKHLKSLGYEFAKYASSRAFVSPDVILGENSFVFENNTLQSEVVVGPATIIWSGNHIGHQTRIGDGVFITSHVAIGGRTNIAQSCYFGMNSTVRDQLNIGEKTLLGANSYLNKDFVGNAVLFGSPAKILPGSDPMGAI